MKPFAVLIPKGANIEELVSVFAPKMDVDYLKYLVHYVVSAGGKKNRDEISLKYVPICSQKLLVRNDKHKEHIAFLGTCWSGEQNILHRKRYEEGSCYSYRLSPKYRNEFLEISYINDGKLIKKIKKRETVFPLEMASRNGKYNYLLKFFNSDDLTIDLDAAVALCNKRYIEHKDRLKYASEMTAVVELYNGVYKVYHVEETDGRIHSNIGCLPKVYRQFVRFKGKQLVEVDLSNSIIYFLAILFNGFIKEDTMKEASLLYMFYKSLESLDILESELLFKLAVNGQFYECFIEPFKVSFDFEQMADMYGRIKDDEYVGSYEQNREIVKKQVLSMFFADNMQYVEIQKIVRQLFPNILCAICEFKETWGYKKFSHILFQFESEVVLGFVGKAFNRRFWREAPLFSLHDCLITTKDYGAKLKDVMVEGFTNLFSIAPKMEEKKW